MRFAVISNETGKVTSVKYAERLGEILPAESETLVLLDSYFGLRGASDQALLDEYTYDTSAGTWTRSEVSIPLEQAQEDKITEIKSKFALAFNTGYMTSLSIKMDADFDSISKLMALKSLAETAGITEGLTIGDYDNQQHEVSLSELTQILIELGMNTQALFKKKWDLRNAVTAATTTEEVGSIVW